MGAVFYDLTLEELCDLMCGSPEDDGEEAEDGISNEDILGGQQGGSITGN